ncbi:large conductance calcium-activated potassium channel [Aureococcus anophagefferens]|nr:large conductance calcium-activated potassium channel [Aureococcus anophagefferens]
MTLALPAHFCGLARVTVAVTDRGLDGEGDGAEAASAFVDFVVSAANDAPAVVANEAAFEAVAGDDVELTGLVFTDADAGTTCGAATLEATFAVDGRDRPRADAARMRAGVADGKAVTVRGGPDAVSATRIFVSSDAAETVAITVDVVDGAGAGAPRAALAAAFARKGAAGEAVEPGLILETTEDAAVALAPAFLVSGAKPLRLSLSCGLGSFAVAAGAKLPSSAATFGDRGVELAGAPAELAATLAKLVYVPARDDFGVDELLASVDGFATVAARSAVRVAAANDAPAFSGDAFLEVTLGRSAALGLAVNDADGADYLDVVLEVDRGALSAPAVDGCAEVNHRVGGLLAPESEDDPVVAYLAAGRGVFAYDAPEAPEDAFRISFAASDVDVFGAGGRVFKVRGTRRGLVAAMASICYAPFPDANGADTLRVGMAKRTDETSLSSSVLDVLAFVAPREDAPVAAAAAAPAVAPVGAAAAAALALSVADADAGDALEVVVFASAGDVRLGGGAAGAADRVNAALASAVYASPEHEGAVAVAVAATGQRRGAATAIDVVSQAGAGPALAVAPRGDVVVAGVLFEATEDAVAAVPPLVLSSASYSDAACVNVSLALAFGSLTVDGVEGLELWSANASHLGFAGSRAAADAALANLRFAAAGLLRRVGADGIDHGRRSSPPSPRSAAARPGPGRRGRGVSVAPVNDAPTLALAADAVAVPAAFANGTERWTALLAGVVAGDADSGASRRPCPSPRRAAPRPPAGVRVLDAPDASTVAFRGPPARVADALAGAVEFLPAGPDATVATIALSDRGGCGAGGEASAAATLAVAVDPPAVALQWTSPAVVAGVEDAYVDLPAALAASGAGDAATLAVRADHGAVAVLETPGGLDFFEPAERVRLQVDAVAALGNGVSETWTVRTNVDWRRAAVRLRFDLVMRDGGNASTALRALAASAATVGLSHRNRSAFADVTLGPDVSAAKANLVAALDDVETVGAGFSVAVERYDAEALDPTDDGGPLVARAWFVRVGVRRERHYAARATTAPEVQRVAVRSNGTSTAGSFSLVYRARAHDSRRTFADGAFETRRLPHNATARAVRDALEALPGVGLVDVAKVASDGDVALADYCWCGRCANATNARARRADAVPTPAPTAEVYGCDFFPKEHAWEITFWTSGDDVPPLVVLYGSGASDGSRARCSSCAALLPAWPAATAEAAGVDDRAAVATVQAGTAALGGEFALRWGSATTSYVSAASATPGHVYGALVGLDGALAAPGALRVTRSAPTREGASTWTVTFDARFGNVAPLAAVADRLAGTSASARATPVAVAARGPRRLRPPRPAPGRGDGGAARSYAILGAAAVPAAVDEVQTLRCAREVGDDADDGFRFVFRGLKSPKIRMGAAPVPELLPACPAADACRGDGSSLAEILEAWLRGAGVLGAGGSLAVASTGTTLCSDPAKGGAALPNAVGGFEARGWGLGAPTLTNITFLGGGPGGVGGDVDEFLVVKRAASNGTILELAETTRGSAAAVGEVQVVETALALNSTDANGTAANESSVRGVFELGFRGATTAPLSHDASAGELAAALNALDTIAPDGTHDYGALGSSRVSVAEASPGTAPAWGTFAVAWRSRATRAGAPTAPLQLDASAATVEAALRRLDGAGRAEVALVDNPAAPFGPLWTVSGLDGGATLALEDVALVGAVDFCENCTSWAGCAPCGDAAAPAAPSLRTARLARDGAARGAPHAVAAALDRALFLPDADYNVLVDGFADVAFAVAAGGGADALEAKAASRRCWRATPAAARPGGRASSSRGRAGRRRRRWRRSSTSRRDYGSEQITAEVQRVVVGGVPGNVVQTVSARATGGAVVAGNFTLSLSCAYLRSGVVEVVARFRNASLFDDPAALARTYDRLRGALANATQEFTLAHDAPARRPRNASFEGLLQDALDGCAATGLDAARDLGLGVPARINESAHTHYLAGASVWRSELDDRDDSYAWEATILGAPRDFPALKVVANNATGRPAGLRAVPRVDGNLTFAISDDAAPVVDVSVARPSALGDAFRLSFDGATTPDLPIDASSARVEEALERLATVGDVLVHRDYARSAVASGVFAWTVEFLASGSPAHVGPEVLLEAAGSAGVGVARGLYGVGVVAVELTDARGAAARASRSVAVAGVDDAPVVSATLAAASVAAGETAPGGPSPASTRRGPADAGADLRLEGLAVVADCGGATALRLLLLPATADDDDDDPARRGRVHFLDAASDVVEVMELPNGGLSLAAPGPTARLGAVQINAVLPRVAFAPPADFDGLARLSCVLEASGGDRSGVATRDFWVAVASENGAPELALSGASRRAAGDARSSSTRRRGTSRSSTRRGPTPSRSGASRSTRTRCSRRTAAPSPSPTTRTLLSVDVAVAWVDEPAGGASLALSLEAGCGNQACGALHFSSGDDRSAAAALSFRGRRARDAGAARRRPRRRRRLLAVARRRRARRRPRRGARGRRLRRRRPRGDRGAADGGAPPRRALRLTGAGQVVRTGEDAVARLAGLGVAGGANVAAGYGACARDEPLEVRLAAAHGVVGATFDPDHCGVAVARAKDGSLAISGNRAAVEAALSGNALGRVLQDL